MGSSDFSDLATVDFDPRSPVSVMRVAVVRGMDRDTRSNAWGEAIFDLLPKL